jgi:hypothetical protein
MGNGPFSGGNPIGSGFGSGGPFGEIFPQSLDQLDSQAVGMGQTSINNANRDLGTPGSSAQQRDDQNITKMGFANQVGQDLQIAQANNQWANASNQLAQNGKGGMGSLLGGGSGGFGGGLFG